MVDWNVRRYFQFSFDVFVQFMKAQVVAGYNALCSSLSTLNFGPELVIWFAITFHHVRITRDGISITREFPVNFLWFLGVQFLWFRKIAVPLMYLNPHGLSIFFVWEKLNTCRFVTRVKPSLWTPWSHIGNWDMWSASCLGRFTPQWKCFRFTMNRRLSGLKG